VVDELEQDADRDREGDHEQPVDRIGDRPQRRGALERLGRLGRAWVAAEDRKDKVGDDERNPDRQQHLGQLTATDATQQNALGEQPDSADGGTGDDDPGHPAASDCRGGDADGSAEQVQRPVGQVHDPHHAEDEREPGCDKEQERPERETVQCLEGEELQRQRDAPDVARRGLGPVRVSVVLLHTSSSSHPAKHEHAVPL
jgi:hypothetical protein